MSFCLELLSRVVLGIPNNKWESISMDFNVSLPLAQRGINVIWVVFHWLRKMKPAQRQYDAQEKVLFAVIHALKTCRHYHYGNCLVVITYHQSLKYFCDQQDLVGCIKVQWTLSQMHGITFMIECTLFYWIKI